MRITTIIAVSGLLACSGPGLGAAMNEVKTADLKRVLALFGKVAEAKSPVIGANGRVDVELLGLSFGGDGGKLWSIASRATAHGYHY